MMIGNYSTGSKNATSVGTLLNFLNFGSLLESGALHHFDSIPFRACRYAHRLRLIRLYGTRNKSDSFSRYGTLWTQLASTARCFRRLRLVPSTVLSSSSTRSSTTLLSLYTNSFDLQGALSYDGSLFMVRGSLIHDDSVLRCRLSPPSRLALHLRCSFTSRLVQGTTLLSFYTTRSRSTLLSKSAARSPLAVQLH